MDALLAFLVPIATGLFWVGSAAYRLMTYNDLRQRGVRVEAQVVGPVPGVPASHSRSRGEWVINPLLSFTTSDGRTVRHGVGSKNRPVRVRQNTQVTVFHAPDDPRELVLDGHGVRARAYTELVLGLSLVLIIALLMIRAF
ncbi:DUF3592 domain-containing protein [Streptomyces ipomoeae]|uniref:DUF3592 domain-containing protein n=1 Tax=Streptomyces ipomoeae TaxID=103232 RepID=UPI0002F4D341|nr:DUF3592 domain-containing protein [Streptomyces ipomoeae]MDX2693717.1 DUF3592 domain-containing protein [Streptomyces ipomoeae]MDX2821401.1 DUF3592 domain-containing protein [Streptomyces ipomoeae]MDX2839616.1 DUF3592 domain-containing protein [Streptomyces ipomoeae]MDX2874135.1 DUF3592 domain-containing protein [Streptomyces ipomoeae]